MKMKILRKQEVLDMNWKHLIWIIPISLLVGFGMGGFIGYGFGLYSIEVIDDMAYRMDGCCLQTLSYVQEQNNDCNILITGKMRQCYYNETEIESEDNTPQIEMVNVVGVKNIQDLRKAKGDNR